MNHCIMCPLALESQVPGVGPARPKLIVVGEAPNKDDEAKGMPFQAGKDPNREYPNLIIRSTLRGMGYDDEADVYWAYALRCNPHHRAEKNVKVKPAWVKTCRTVNLEGELAKVHAPVILAVGKLAVESLLPFLKGGVAKNRGTWHEIVLGGQQRLVRVTFSMTQIENQSCWRVEEDDRGRFKRTTRLPLTGTCPYFFKKDMIAIREKLLELDLGPTPKAV